MRFVIEKRAEKFIRKQPKLVQERLLRAIYQLPQGDCKPLKGHEGVFRLRVGDYRILYTVDNGQMIIFVIDAGNRGDIYLRY